MSLTKIRGNTQIMDLSIGNAQIANAAGIELQKIEDGLILVKADGSVDFTAPQVGVTPTLPSHLTTKEYVDSVATGLDVKLSVRAISTANITLSGTQTIDGVSLIAGDRVLVTGQTTGSQNGIYVVSAGSWSRSADADNSPAGEVTSGMFTFIEEGSTFGGTGWVLTTANPIVLGVTALTFAQFSSAGVIVAGAGLVKTGNTVDVVSANGGIVVNANNIELTLADNTLEIVGGGLKLASLAQANILIGDASGVATAQTISGDATLTAAGVLTISNGAVTGAKIATGSVGLNKLVSASTGGQIIVSNSSGVPTYVTPSGDVTVSDTGSIQLVANSVGSTEIADGAVLLDKIEALDQAKFIIGTASGNAQVEISGDVTIDEDGVAVVNGSTVLKLADIVKRETPAEAPDGVNTAFTIATDIRPGTEEVYLNGILMDEGIGNDYTASANVVNFNFAPNAGDKVRVSYIKL